jgi:hypothetical protein
MDIALIKHGNINGKTERRREVGQILEKHGGYFNVLY